MPYQSYSDMVDDSINQNKKKEYDDYDLAQYNSDDEEEDEIVTEE